MVPLRVVFIAPAPDVLDDEPTQAERILRAWEQHGDVEVRTVHLRTFLSDLMSLSRDVARADVVHVLSAPSSPGGIGTLSILAAARVLGRPVILSYRDNAGLGELGRSAIARRVLGTVATHIVPSTFMADALDRLGIQATMIPNVIDLETFRFRERDPLRPRLVSTRDFEPLENVAATIRAFKIVQDRWRDASLTLVGSGSQEADLRALAAELGLRNVAFVGRTHEADLAALYSENDIYLQSANVDNMPTSILQAFASGLPVVSTEAGGVPAVLTHGVHGLLVPLADYETLGHHVVRLLARPDYARDLARAAHASCEGYTWPHVQDQWIRAYTSVLEGAYLMGGSFAAAGPFSIARDLRVGYATTNSPASHPGS